MGFNILARAHEVFRYPAIGLAATDKKIKEHPDEATKTVKALIRANRYMRADRIGAIEVLKDWARIAGDIPEDGLRLLIEHAKKELKITREVPMAEVWNQTILREAQKELRTKGR